LQVLGIKNGKRQPAKRKNAIQSTRRPYRNGMKTKTQGERQTLPRKKSPGCDLVDPGKDDQINKGDQKKLPVETWNVKHQEAGETKRAAAKPQPLPQKQPKRTNNKKLKKTPTMGPRQPS